MTSPSTNKPARVLIVGGGIAGLATAHRLLGDSRWKKRALSITLTESKGRYGGRVKTVSLGKSGGWYEAGASRVADAHRRVRALGEAVGCTEIALHHSYDQRSVMPSLHKTFRRIYQKFVAEQGEQALRSVSWWDVLTIICEESERDRLVRQWGFMSVLTQMNAYDFWHHAMPQYLHKAYYTFEGGLQTLVNNTVELLKKDRRVCLKPATKVVSVDVVPKQHHPIVFRATMQDDTNSSIYHERHDDHVYIKEFDIVFFALPAEALCAMKGITEMHTHFWTSVSRNRLIRCYAKYQARANHPNGTQKRRDRQLCRSRVKSSILNKCTTTHAPEWRQISYCDHTHADHIYNILRMPNGLQHFKRVVHKTLGKHWATFGDADFDVHYWKAGTHSWKPQLLSDAHYDRILQPDAKLPMFVVGSSFSHYQHWMEGALETVDDACKKCWRYAVEWWNLGKGKTHHRTSTHTTHMPPFYLHNACQRPDRQHEMKDVQANGWVVLDGYVYDIQPFVHKHPGGRNILEHMTGKDISVAYHRIGHSSTARAWAEEHCKGTLLTK